MNVTIRIILVTLLFICGLGIQNSFTQLDSKMLGTWDYSTKIEVDDTIRILHYQFRFFENDSIERIIYREGDNNAIILSGKVIKNGKNKFDFQKKKEFIRDKSGTIALEKAVNSVTRGQETLTFKKVRKKTIVIQIYFPKSGKKLTQKMMKFDQQDF